MNTRITKQNLWGLAGERNHPSPRSGAKGQLSYVRSWLLPPLFLLSIMVMQLSSVFSSVFEKKMIFKIHNDMEK